jgi:hypothetical protein
MPRIDPMSTVVPDGAALTTALSSIALNDCARRLPEMAMMVGTMDSVAVMLCRAGGGHSSRLRSSDSEAMASSRLGNHRSVGGIGRASPSMNFSGSRINAN